MKKTPLNQKHIDLGAKMVDFGGWHMPVQYSGLSNEHQAVRTKAGLFDVSHMGEVDVKGTGSETFLNFLVTNNVSKLVDGQAQYTVMCYENGGIVDDLLVYRLAKDHYLLCINAGNIEKDWEWIQKQASSFSNVEIKNVSNEYCQIALQGPESEKILTKYLNLDLQELKYYRFLQTTLNEKKIIVSRTGYTGEDGFEIYAPASLAETIWDSLLDKGKDLGLIPCGLGARDTLRTEMKFPLYGHEIDQNTNPLMAGLGWVVKLDKPEKFCGQTTIEQEKEKGIRQSLVGLLSEEKGIPRQGYEVWNQEKNKLIGKVTSGTLSPSLAKPIAIAYIEKEFANLDTVVTIKIRDRFFSAKVVKTPFYKKS
ncbi:MAG: glycine cleavage system aminomethyltransferase GcvT [Oligoflexia bacterium]|nr:glycine cleavage system aminomethyltransferase GcvT [Oligoflexia bacterium]